MTNAQIFKTVNERSEAYLRFCRGQDQCHKCKLYGDHEDNGSVGCVFKWLELEFTEEPKPCPFCGNKNIRVYDSEKGLRFVACCGCGCRTEIQINEAMAITAWNRRSI